MDGIQQRMENLQDLSSEIRDHDKVWWGQYLKILPRFGGYNKIFCVRAYLQSACKAPILSGIISYKLICNCNKIDSASESVEES